MRMTMSAAGEAVLYLEGDIGAWGWTPQMWGEKVTELRDAGCSALLVRINSPGGSVTDALGIVDCITALRAEMPVRALVCGLCASAATIIACACESVSITPNSTWMVHEPSCTLSGSTAELRAQMQAFEAARAKVYAIYAAATGKTAEQVAADHVTEKYYTAAEAVAYGFCRMEGGAPADEQKEQAETPADEPAPDGGADDEPTEVEPEADDVEEKDEDATMFRRFCAWMRGERGRRDERADACADGGLRRELESVRAELAGARAALDAALAMREATQAEFQTKVNKAVAAKMAAMVPEADALPPADDTVRPVAAVDMAAVVKAKGWDGAFARLR